jgi:hypothetical protein
MSGFEIADRRVPARRRRSRFYAADAARRRINLTNVLQLGAEFPVQVGLAAYRSSADVIAQLAE